jgi:hypothetical protein
MLAPALRGAEAGGRDWRPGARVGTFESQHQPGLIEDLDKGHYFT